MQMSQATMQSGRARPMTVLQDDELTWLSPEQYAGERLQAATDQYYIGLLGLELLTGAPPVLVRSYADLDKKRRSLPHRWPRSRSIGKEFLRCFSFLPECSSVAPKIGGRAWPTAPIRHSRRSPKGLFPKRCGCKASKSYDELQDSPFYRNFYEELFRSAPDVVQRSFPQDQYGRAAQEASHGSR